MMLIVTHNQLFPSLRAFILTDVTNKFRTVIEEKHIGKGKYFLMEFKISNF